MMTDIQNQYSPDTGPEVTELHRQSASGFLCWPMDVIDLCKKDSDLPAAIEKLAVFIARWEEKGKASSGNAQGQGQHEVCEALDAIDRQLNEMRSLKGWRLNLIRENMAKLRAALAPGNADPARDLSVLETLLASTCFGKEVCQFPPCACASSVAAALAPGNGAVEAEGYFSCRLPPGACGCPQGARQHCANSYWKAAAPSPAALDPVTVEHCASLVYGFNAACNSPDMQAFVDADVVQAVYNRDFKIGDAIRALIGQPASNGEAVEAAAKYLDDLEAGVLPGNADTPSRVAEKLRAISRVTSTERASGLSDFQRRLDASVTPQQAAESVRRERETLANRDKPHHQPDGFINDYD